MTEEQDKPKRFSYSAATMLQSCAEKYRLKYVKKVARDSDAEEDASAFCFGKAFHQVMELTGHEQALYTEDIFIKAVLDNKVDSDDYAKVFACCMQYYQLHSASRLSVDTCEIEIGDENIVGYVDAVMSDANGNWWIVDLKTSGMIVGQLWARLPLDPQLNLYAAYAWQIADKCNLDLALFQGTRYRVVAKPRSAVKVNESHYQYLARAKPEVYDIEIPLDVMQYTTAVDKMLALKARANALTADKDTERNFGSCLAYNRPCEYWSNCHRRIFTQCQNAAQIFTAQTMVDRTKEKSVKDIIDSLM